MLKKPLLFSVVFLEICVPAVSRGLLAHNMLEREKNVVHNIGIFCSFIFRNHTK